jgi:hypothetical protein
MAAPPDVLSIPIKANTPLQISPLFGYTLMYVCTATPVCINLIYLLSLNKPFSALNPLVWKVQNDGAGTVNPSAEDSTRLANIPCAAG